MNRVYHSLMKRPDPDFKKALRASQRAWLSYRDAELKLLFPWPLSQYGSMHPMCTSLAAEELTRLRAEELGKLLDDKNETCRLFSWSKVELTHKRMC